MTDGWKEIAAPATRPSLTAAQVATGPVIPPQQKLLLYSDDQWEDFVQEWAHYCLKPEYVKVWRFTGAGDRGIDVAGFVDAAELNGVWDNYQCKHYGPHGCLGRVRQDHLVQPQGRVQSASTVLLRCSAGHRNEAQQLSPERREAPCSAHPELGQVRPP
jgi:hypothetical protein